MDAGNPLGMGLFAHGMANWVTGIRGPLGMGVFAKGTADWIMNIKGSYGAGVFAKGTADRVPVLFNGCVIFVSVTVRGDELTGVEVEYT